MRSVRQKDTGPELAIRKALFALGYRYRLHSPNLPGRPDIVFPSRRKAIFVHGCFWHSHDCPKGKAPKSRSDYWLPKLQANVARDARALDNLKKQGWRTLVIWQCEIDKIDTVLSDVEKFLRDDDV